MASAMNDVPNGYSLVQLEAGLSRTSLASVLTADSSSSDELADQERNTTVPTAAHSMKTFAGTIERPLFTGTINEPPQNFGLVVPGVYRSSYPQSPDFIFLQSLKLKTIVTLVEKEIPEGYRAFLDRNGIQHIVFDMAGTKKADIPLTMMRSIIRLVVDTQNHPLLIHCNQGKHRTGCVVGVLRRYHGWDTTSVLDEYERFAHPKTRPTDVQYLREFQLTSIRHVVAQKHEEVGLTIPLGHLVCLYVIVVLGLLTWIFTTYGVISMPVLGSPKRLRVGEI